MLWIPLSSDSAALTDFSLVFVYFQFNCYFSPCENCLISSIWKHPVYLSLCLSVCMWSMYIVMWECGHVGGVYMHVCTWRLAADIQYLSQLFFTIWGDRNSQWTWSSLIWLGWEANGSQDQLGLRMVWTLLFAVHQDLMPAHQPSTELSPQLPNSLTAFLLLISFKYRKACFIV